MTFPYAVKFEGWSPERAIDFVKNLESQEIKNNRDFIWEFHPSMDGYFVIDPDKRGRYAIFFFKDPKLATWFQIKGGA